MRSKIKFFHKQTRSDGKREQNLRSKILLECIGIGMREERPDTAKLHRKEGSTLASQFLGEFLKISEKLFNSL